MTGGIIGGWAVINGADWAVYRSAADPITGAMGIGNIGFSYNGQNPFGAYSNNLSNGVAADNITDSGDRSDLTSRTVNSVSIRKTDATSGASYLFRSMNQLLSISTGGILTNNNGQDVNFLNGRITAGTTADSTVYVWANNGSTVLLSRFEDNGAGKVNFVKSGPAPVTMRVEPRIELDASTASSAVITTAGANSTGATGVPGVVVGMGYAGTMVMGMPTGSIVTEVNSGTTYTISQNVTASATTNANQTMTAPVTQVIAGLTLSNAAATVTVPAGTIVYPGMSVTTAVGSTGALAASTTVLGVAGTTVTLSATPTTTGAARLLFGAVAAQSSTGVALTSGTNTFTVAANTLGLNVGQVVTVTGGTGTLPANTTITAYDRATGVVTLSAKALTSGTPTTMSYAALTERSLITSTTSTSATARVFSSVGLFVGQPVQGPGIAPGTTVASIVDANTITLSAAATATGAANAYFAATPAVGRTAIGATTSTSGDITMASTAEVAGLAAGMYVQGVGIPQNTVIGSISGTTVSLVSASTGAVVTATATHASNNLIFGAPIANFNAKVATTGTAATNAATLTVASATGLAVGMPVFGAGIANGTTVIGISGTTVTLSANTIAALTSGTAVSFTSPLPYFSNTYTGDTVVNQGTTTAGTLNISNSSSQLGGIIIPGNLILNNAAATQATGMNGSISSTSNVTLNGGSVLTLVGQNTLQSITFNNIGGTATPTVTGGTLFVTGAITSTNDNFASTPTVASILELNGQSKTLTASGSSPMGLIFSGVIQNTMNSSVPAGLIKTGNSSLVLSGASTFAGGVQHNEGTLILGAASTASTVGAGITSGPLGTGTLTLAAGTTLQSDGTSRTLSNPIVVNGNITLGGTSSTHGFTLNGAVNLGSAARTINGLSPQALTTIGGVITGSAGGLTKTGNGVLVFTPTTTGALSAAGAAANATVLDNQTLTLSASAAAGLVAGMPVHGTGIAPGTVINSVSGAAITLSKAAVATTAGGSFAFGSTSSLAPSVGAAGATVLTVSAAEAANLVVGASVSGVGIAALTTITAVDTATGVVTINNALTSNVAGQNITFGGATAVNSFNTYAGATIVSGGMLRLGNLGALPAGTALSVLSGGTLDINADTTVASLAGDSATSGGLITNSSTTTTVTLKVGDANSTSFGGAITNNVGSTLNLLKQGAGTLTFGGPNSYTGTTTISAGVLQVGTGSTTGSLGTGGVTNNASLVFNRSNAATVANAISGTGSVTQSGSGNLTLSGANSYSGDTLVSAGTLTAVTGALAGTSGITVSAAATLAAVDLKSGATLTLSDATSTAEFTGATLTVGAVSNVSTTTTGLKFSASSGTITLASLSGAGKTTFSSAATITTGGISAGTVSVTGVLNSAISAGTVTAGSLTSSSITGGTNTITGAATVTAISGGTTSIAGAANITTLTTGTVNLTGTTATVTNVNGGTLTLASTALTATTGTGSATLTLNASSSAVFSGVGGSLGAVSNDGSAVNALNFSATTGTITLASLAGTGKTTFGSVAAITTLTSGTVNLNGATSTIGTLSGGTIALGSATALTVNDGTYGGAISGTTGTLTKATVGLLTLTGTNTYAGGTTISAGTLQLGNGGTTGSLGAGVVTNNAAFVISRSDDLTFANNITGTGSFTKLGTNNLTLTGANDYAGATLISAGTLTAGDGALAGTSGITLAANTSLSAVNYNLAATLGLDAAATATFSGTGLAITGAITNAGTATNALNFTGAAKVTLTSLAGVGKTRFGNDADITGGVAEGEVTVVGALGANVTGGTVSAGSLTGNVSGASTSVTVTGNLAGNVLAGTGTVSAGSMTGSVASSVSVTGLLTGVITAGTNSLGSLNSTSVTGGTTTVTGVASITTMTSGTVNLRGATASIGTLTNGSINLGTSTLSTALTVNSGTFAGLISGTKGSLIKATEGILTITSANTFGGGTTINAGTILISDASALGTGLITIASGAFLDLASIPVTNAISAVSPASILNGQTAASINTSTAEPTIINSVVTGNTGLSKADGNLTLNTPNFYTGSTAASGAAAVIKAAFLDDTSSSLGASTLTDPANLKLSSGAKLEFTGGGNAVTSRSFTIEGSAGIAATGTGTLEFTSASKLATTGDTPGLTLSASNIGDNRFAATILTGNPLATLAIDGTGTWVIGAGANRFKGDVRISAAAGTTIGLENASLPSGATLAVANNATIRWEAGNTTGVKLEIASGATAKLNLGTNSVVFNAAPAMTGAGSSANFEKQGSGTLTIAGNVNAGAFNFTLPANSGMLSVGAGGIVGDVSLATGSKLGGTGTVGNVTAVSGSRISPGNSPGTLSGGTIGMPGGSIFDWQVQDATDHLDGYDKLALTGNLDLRGASKTSRVIFNVQSLLGTGNGTTLGRPLHFDPPAGTSTIRVFDFATVAGDVLLPVGLQISDVFEFRLNDFMYSDGSASNAGLWSINWDDANNLITVTAVPEPSTYGFGLGALALAAAAIRRRRKNQPKA